MPLYHSCLSAVTVSSKTRLERAHLCIITETTTTYYAEYPFRRH